MQLPLSHFFINIALQAMLNLALYASLRASIHTYSFAFSCAPLISCNGGDRELQKVHSVFLLQGYILLSGRGERETISTILLFSPTTDSNQEPAANVIQT